MICAFPESRTSIAQISDDGNFGGPANIVRLKIKADEIFTVKPD